MATESVFKTVEIKSKKEFKAFVRALEASMKKPSKEVHLSKPYKELTGEELRKFLS